MPRQKTRMLVRPEDVAGHQPYTVKKFDGMLDLGKPGERGKGKFIFFFGKRGSGKSVAMKYVIYQNRLHFWTAVAMSAVANTWRDYETFLPKSMVYESVDLPALDRIWDLCSKLQALTQTELHPVSRKKIEFEAELGNVLIAIDDGSDEKNALDNYQMRSIAKKGRHSCITYMLATQNFIAVPKEQRAQADMILIGRCPDADGRENLFKYFFKSVFDNRSEFNSFMDEYTTDHRFLVFDKEKDPTPSECMAVIAPVYAIEPFRVGHRDMWLRDALFRKRKVSTSLSVLRRNMDGDEEEFDVDRDDLMARLTLDGCSQLLPADAAAAAQSASFLLAGGGEGGGNGGHTHTHDNSNSDVHIFCKACADEKRNKVASSSTNQALNLRRHQQLAKQALIGTKPKKEVAASGGEKELVRPTFSIPGERGHSKAIVTGSGSRRDCKKGVSRGGEGRRGGGGGGGGGGVPTNKLAHDLAKLAAFRKPMHRQSGHRGRRKRRGGREGGDRKGTPSRIESRELPGTERVRGGQTARGATGSRGGGRPAPGTEPMRHRSESAHPSRTSRSFHMSRLSSI